MAAFVPEMFIGTKYALGIGSQGQLVIGTYQGRDDHSNFLIFDTSDLLMSVESKRMFINPDYIVYVYKTDAQPLNDVHVPVNGPGPVAVKTLPNYGGRF